MLVFEIPPLNQKRSGSYSHVRWDVFWGSLSLWEHTGFHRCTTWLSEDSKLFNFVLPFSLLRSETPTLCRVFAKKSLDVVHRYMNKYLCKTVSVQCVNTLNYYGRKIKSHTLLWNVCSVTVVTPAGRTEK